MSWLYRYEAKGIQSFILGTEKLREMAGASDLVEHLGDEARKRAQACGGEEVMVAAGSATFRFPDDAALEAFAADWPRAVDALAPGLQLIQAWAPLEDGRFPEALSTVLKRLEAARNHPQVELPEAGPFVARAGRTGRPAVRSGDDGHFDRSSLAKHEQQGRPFFDHMRTLFGLGERHFVTNLEDFGEGYLAVIHADGNGVGQHIIKTVSAWDVRKQVAFSKALTDATGRAAATAFKAIDDPKLRRVPFRPLVVGGDDLTVITRAQDAFPFVTAFLDDFEQQTRKAKGELGKEFTAAAGICFVKTGHPFHAAHAIAEALCKQAKTVKDQGSSFSFFRVTTAHAASLKDLRRDELTLPIELQRPDGRTGHYSLEARPWTRERRALLIELSKRLAHVPRGGLREWLRLVKVDPPRAERHWERVLEVMRTASAAKRTEAGKLVATLKALNQREHLFDAGGSTPLLDAATWMSFQKETA